MKTEHDRSGGCYTIGRINGRLCIAYGVDASESEMLFHYSDGDMDVERDQWGNWIAQDEFNGKFYIAEGPTLEAARLSCIEQMAEDAELC